MGARSILILLLPGKVRPMRGRRALALLLAVAVPLSAAGAAQADRKPTVKERRALAKVLGVPTECAQVRISTETKKPRWASVAFKLASPSCEPFGSNGVTVAKKRSGRWRAVTSGSDFICSALYQDVPRPVVQDLKIRCR
jgi:hypothetical protein